MIDRRGRWSHHMWKTSVRGILLGLVMGDMRAKGRGEHVIQPFADGANGGSFGRFLPAGRSARCERTFRIAGGDHGVRCGGTFCTMGAIIGSGRGARVVAAGGLDLPGSSFLTGSSRHGCAWLMGLALYVPGIAPVDPGYIDSGSGFEFATWPLSADDEEVLMLRLECVTSVFLPLTSPSPGGELLAVFRSPTVFFRWLDAIRDYLLPLYQMIDFGKWLYLQKGIRTGCPDAPSDDVVSHGVSRSTIILRMAVRDHGDGMWAMAACCDCV
ncbi:hypothetical protein CK203_018631 [Vitis vinifera]|uniref:Uncharacterized protein n=1 Tax=Vitis vinifera TaxID=29760 RepID=A0A438JB45_VITVI|nr:hypothetical protein CK203_018631 [Vitis vinifera]